MTRLSVPALQANVGYSGTQGVSTWEGYEVSDKEAFRRYLKGPVAQRALDTDENEAFEQELDALAGTGMSREYLDSFLAAVPAQKGWEVGEALAEVLLEDDSNRSVIWPWHSGRDRRTPLASLPGADLVGFCRDAKGFALLIGEVKSSRDKSSPPNVMYGKKGLTWQLEYSATELSVQLSLLKWLRCRCTAAETHEAYKEAAARYVSSSGKDLYLVGMLLRDTSWGSRRSRAKTHVKELCA